MRPNSIVRRPTLLCSQRLDAALFLALVALASPRLAFAQNLFPDPTFSSGVSAWTTSPTLPSRLDWNGGPGVDGSPGFARLTGLVGGPGATTRGPACPYTGGQPTLGVAFSTFPRSHQEVPFSIFYSLRTRRAGVRPSRLFSRAKSSSEELRIRKPGISHEDRTSLRPRRRTASSFWPHYSLEFRLLLKSAWISTMCISVHRGRNLPRSRSFQRLAFLPSFFLLLPWPSPASVASEHVEHW